MKSMKKKVLFVVSLIVVILLVVYTPTIIGNVKHTINVNKIPSEKRAFLEEIKKQAKEGEMIKSPFKIGESSENVIKKWGSSDAFGKEMDENTVVPFYMDAFTNAILPDEVRSLIYSKNDVKFDLNNDKKIKQITSVDKRLDKLQKNELTYYFGEPTIESKDYAVYKVGDYQLLFQFWHDGEFFNTNRYTLLQKDSSKSIKTIKEIARYAKQGKAKDVPFPIGTPIEEVLKLWGKPQEKNIPGTSYTFKNALIELDEKSKKIIDIMTYNEENVTFVEVKNTLGKPYKEEIGQKVTDRTLTYKYGKYEVLFSFYSETTSNPELIGYSIK